MTFTANLYNSERLIPPANEPADEHWLPFAAHQMYMSQVQRDEPVWYAEYEDCAELAVDAEAALRLLMTAPSEYAAGLLMGRALLLKELAAMGRGIAITTF